MANLKPLGRIVDSGLVAVVRAESPEQASRIADACAQAGVAAIEITFTVPDPASVIAELTRRYPKGEMLIGAGTVLDPETAAAAVAAGAQFVVAPCLNLEVARFCNRRQIPYMPGAGTVKEIVEAMECGAEIIKVFPGETLGPQFVKAVRGPLPHALLMPTGGVTLENVQDWLRAGCVAVGVGSSLCAGAKSGDYQAITDLARQFIAKIRDARNQAHGKH
ncbi:MAG TPA: bifunctional 2-keto-4-hydroxyglutarate aldolase/2-keto-3-deoxy-6-phosphogluconate aldolase [Candidatus Dormibacteraeota bacterium]|nr:bifunctional 2-keto-4-hydroxyglutarate aldolase/2-keto-3-deoxy-6-phosphogluconate aldolase [Candidatus Dormibacteraeota bacterium]